MSDYLTSKQMRSLEDRAIESGKVTAIELMARAGEAVFEAILEIWPDAESTKKAVVFAGPGNNGGDGFAVALLLQKRGWTVTVCFYGRVDTLPPSARFFHDQWRASPGSKTVPLSFPETEPDDGLHVRQLLEAKTQHLLVLDALFGIGLSRPLSGFATILEILAEAHMAKADNQTCKFVAVDVPSGLSEDGPLGIVFPADVTVTFHKKKEAHRRGQRFCGQIIVKDIGL